MPPHNLTEGGGQKIWADGIRPSDANLLEAKYVGNPARSPYIPDSQCPPNIRAWAQNDVDGEFQRYAAVIADSSTPVTELEVITNDQRAVPFFEQMLQKYNISGKVVVRP